MRLFAAGIVLLLFGVPATASDPAAQEPAEVVANEGFAVDERVSDLARGGFADRQSRMIELWADRQSYKDAVQRAARDADPEVAGRATWILEQWRRGVLPETPDSVVHQVKSADPEDAVEILLEFAQFKPAVVAVEESLGTIDREPLQLSASRALALRFPVYARLAFENKAVPDLLRLIDLVADSKELAVSRIALMNWLGMEIGPDQLLPAAAASWTQAERDEAKVLCLAVQGRLDEAVAIAVDASGMRPRLSRISRMLAGDWVKLARDSAAKANDAEPGSVQKVTYWSDALVAADQADLTPLRDQAIQALIDADDDPVVESLRWQSLAVHGEIEAACEILRGSAPARASELAVASAKHALAFELLDYPVDRVELDLDRWISDAIEAQRQHPEQEIADEVERILALMNCLVSVGRNDLGWEIALGLCRSGLEVGRAPLSAFVMTRIPRSMRRRWCPKLAVDTKDDTLSPTVQNTLVWSLTDTDNETFQILMELMAKKIPKLSLQERVQAVCELVDGGIPQGFDPKQDFRWLYDHLPHARQSRLERVGGQNFFRSELRVTMGMVDFFLRHNQAELGERCLKILADRGENEALFQLAEAEMEAGSHAVAKERFDRLWRTIADQRTKRIRRSPASLAAKTLVAEWILSDRSGDELETQNFERLVQLVACTPSSRTRLELAQFLQESGESELAREIYLTLLPMEAFETDRSTDFYRSAFEYASFEEDQHPHDGARWLDLAFRGRLQSSEYSPLYYVVVPLVIHRWKLDAAITSEDQQQVEKQLKQIVRLNSLDITFAEEQLPKMREVGMGSLADETLNQMIDEGWRYCQTFPLDATSANNLAWVAAVNHRRLNDALELSRQAVYWEPESAVYRDTLAEILYRLGREKEALQIEQACLLDTHDEWHLHEQVKRFKTPFEPAVDE